MWACLPINNQNCLNEIKRVHYQLRCVTIQNPGFQSTCVTPVLISNWTVYRLKSSDKDWKMKMVFLSACEMTPILFQEAVDTQSFQYNQHSLNNLWPWLIAAVQLHYCFFSNGCAFKTYLHSFLFTWRAGTSECVLLKDFSNKGKSHYYYVYGVMSAYLCVSPQTEIVLSSCKAYK